MTTEISKAMIEAAMRAGPMSYRDARRVLSAGLSKMASNEKGAPFPLWINTSVEVTRARFVGPTDRRCYYRVQVEDGRDLVVHGNDIQPNHG